MDEQRLRSLGETIAEYGQLGPTASRELIAEVRRLQQALATSRERFAKQSSLCLAEQTVTLVRRSVIDDEIQTTNRI